MAVVAPLSKYKKTNFKIGIFILIAAAIWFAYDGYFSEGFIKKHTVDGVPDSTLAFHRNSPPFLLAGGVALTAYFLIIRNKKIVADQAEIVFSKKEKIAYDDIQAIDKTKYDAKGFFVIIYKNSSGSEKRRKVSDRKYDNLDSVVDILVEKITS